MKVSGVLSRTMDKVLIAGAGITGAVTASMLRREFPACHLKVWEKANVTGGRMTTSRYPVDTKCTVDLGAQYISTEPKYFTKHKCIYDELLNNGILRPVSCVIEGDRTWPEGSRHFISPTGISAVVKHFLQISGAELKLQHLIEDIQKDGQQYIVRTQHGVTEKFDCVILTMPVPQILKLHGIIQQTIDADTLLKHQLEAVEYSTRFAMGLYFKAGTQLDIAWAAKYFKGDPVIVFVAVDNQKRGQVSAHIGPSILVHASVPFSLKHLHEDEESVCMKYLLPRLRHILPQIPEPVTVKNHKWTYSQVFRAYEGLPGAVVLQSNPLLVCGGDAFTNSGFDRCIDSANALSDQVKQAAESM